VLGDVVDWIRFPTLSTEDVASKVVLEGLLTPVQTLELFTYLAQKDTGEKPGPSLSKFKATYRKGASRYGAPGSKVTQDFQLITIEGGWSYGSADHVSSGDRVPLNPQELSPMLQGVGLEAYKSGQDDWNLPRGTERVGIYTYPTEDRHVLEFKLTKGPAIIRTFRFLCTRLEGGVTMQMMVRGPADASWGDNLWGTNTLPTLTNGGNQKQWVELTIGKTQPIDQFRIEIRGGQCAFHVVQFVIGP